VRVDKSGDQLKTVSMFLFDAAGQMVARLERALLRAVAQAYRPELAGIYHLAMPDAGRNDGAAPLSARVAEHFERVGLPVVSEGWLLLRAHMRAAVAEALRGFADRGGAVDPVALLANAGENAPLRAHVAMLLADAVEGGALLEGGSHLALADTTGQPEAALILGALAAEFPMAAADLALSAQAAEGVAGLFGGTVPAARRVALLQRYEAGSLRLAPLSEAVLGMMDALGGGLHVVVAENGGAGLLSALADRAARGALRLSVAAGDSASAERLRRRMPQGETIEVIDLSAGAGMCCDVVLAAGVHDAGAVAAFTRLLRPGGVLVAAHVRRDSLSRFQLGPADVAEEAGMAAPLAGQAGLADLRQFVAEDEGLELCVAVRQVESEVAVQLTGNGALAPVLSRAGLKVTLLGAGDVAQLGVDLVWAPPGDVAHGGLADVLMGLRALLLDLAALPARPRVWIWAGQAGAATAALRAFARVAMNEFADIDLRFVQGADATALAARLAAPGREREVVLGANGQQVARLRHGLPLVAGKDEAQALALRFPRPGMLENFHWVEVARPEPGPGEVAVELVATGLNFRDVMLAMGLLADDVLDEGLAGAVYGLECAGRVVALGQGVSRFAIGDLVIGFGQSSFASHAVGPHQAFVPLPEGVAPEAGAGLPVAFFTAWYALVECARLRAGETVLIHGGAGGVGLAAIQIARAAGASVIATVSSPDKAALARLYGAAHVYDSRSLDFVEQVRASHGGVDVVLNSLSGEAMRGSLRTLRPRGRFVELGKRDYVANSALALRPFRRNLAYFGVDVDQILALDPELTAIGLEAIAQGFASGAYLPLPTMTYGSGQIAEAFRLMQSAGHVGKIVVAAPPLGNVPSLCAGEFVPGAGVQLVVGGTRGFGLATALWLADRGARRLVVASRAGRVDPAHMPRIAELRARGILFEVMALDVTDAAAVHELVASVTQAHGAISGVWHTAVDLADGMIEGLDEAALARVLAPKVAGATHLHQATQGQPIEHFVMFSSASALIGNPGQGAYAAANGWMEGLARERVAAGQPALAVQWGAIADVGLLADRGETLASLSRIAGVSGMQSAEALARLARVLGFGARLADPVVTISDFAEDGALFSLPVPSSPAFAAHFALRASSLGSAGKSLAELVEGLDEAEAQRLVVAMLAEEAAAIMRLAVAEVDLDASLDSLGMDSLMALELRMSIESKYQVELPMMAISAVGNLKELAQRIVMLVRSDEDEAAGVPLSDVESSLIAIHGGG
ncbi:MAG TPA: type I polyketide synthase, partial [Novosphingobium sp.]|nr:type I polyketide synthase [Novosphingobium sp.]